MSRPLSPRIPVSHSLEQFATPLFLVATKLAAPIPLQGRYREDKSIASQVASPPDVHAVLITAQGQPLKGRQGRQRRRCPHVVDECAFGEAYAFGQYVGRSTAIVHKMDHVDSSHQYEIIRNQSTVTTPP